MIQMNLYISRPTDRENKLMVAKGKGSKKGLNQDYEINRYQLVH